MINLLVTGGNGYIGSNIISALDKNFFLIDVIDKQKKNSLLDKYIRNYFKGDLKNKLFVDNVFKNKYDVVIHCASLIEVNESVLMPSKYYENNFFGTINLLNSMIKNNCNKLIFSSSAAIYGVPKKIPITEDSELNPVCPYGFSKLIIEQLLKDYEKISKLKYITLRYFNACGATKNFGEKHEPETHLIPLIMQALSKRKKEIKIYGDNFKTKDGTCIRDYVHVGDIANAHIKALNYLLNKNKSEIFNIGSGRGFSVKEIIFNSEKVTKKKLFFRIVKPRAGDPEILLASNNKIKRILKWKPKLSSISSIIKSAWSWEKSLLNN